IQDRLDPYVIDRVEAQHLWTGNENRHAGQVAEGIDLSAAKAGDRHGIAIDENASPVHGNQKVPAGVYGHLHVMRLIGRKSAGRDRGGAERHRLTEAIFEAVKGLLEEKRLLLKSGTIVDATIIAAPSSIKNATQTRDPEMKQTRKGKAWHFGMK